MDFLVFSPLTLLVWRQEELPPHLKPDWFFLVPAYPGCPGKEAVKLVIIVIL